MGEIVTTIFSSFTDVIGFMSDGIKTAFMNILYADPNAAEKVISDPVKFFMVLLGMGMAGGLVFGAFKLIRRR